MPKPINQRDEFAEQYVAGILADYGWSIYFPRKDKGFDFIITKKVSENMIIRPVQVKGKYPEKANVKRPSYGYNRGKLTALHEDMVLAMPYFSCLEKFPYPIRIAFMPRSAIKSTPKETFSCLPAKLDMGEIKAKAGFDVYFDEKGLKALEDIKWGKFEKLSESDQN